MAAKLTRGKRVIAFIEAYCKTPEGALVGQPMKLAPFQKKFILGIYDNKAGTRRAYLSIARKNGKTALIAAILLAHLVGPEARLNTQIVSGARSRDQASLVFNLAAKMVQLSAELSKLVKIVPSGKRLIGITRNVEYRALAADGTTAHGLSPVLAILDEVGQVRGPQDDFVDAITTSQGAHEEPLLIAISTQAPNDADLFSIWLDDARKSQDARIVCHVHEAPKDCELNDRKAWKAANPGLSIFRSLADITEQADAAMRMPSNEATFRNLCLNQRVETVQPFISRSTWLLNSREPDPEAFINAPVYAGLDLSGKVDLTAFVMIAQWQGRWHVRPMFWTPEKGLRDRAKRDRAPYDVWADQGLIRTTPGAAIDYEHVVQDIMDAVDGMNLVSIAYDRWRIDLFKRELEKLGLELPLAPYGQGFRDMAPALTALETALLNDQIAHGQHPVLTMCAANAITERDAADNRKLAKHKSTGRIDGMVALAMAFGRVPSESDLPVVGSDYELLSV